MLKKPKYQVYEYVTLAHADVETRCSVRAIDYLILADGNPMYVLWDTNGHEFVVREDEILPTGEYESPLRNGEIVRWTTNVPGIDREGIGVVQGIGLNEETEEWSYGVLTQRGEVLALPGEDLKTTNCVVPESVWQMQKKQVGESKTLYRYVPIPVALEELIVPENRIGGL